jgi:hypothetical protein
VLEVYILPLLTLFTTLYRYPQLLPPRLGKAYCWRLQEHRAFKFVFFPEGITGKDTQKILHIDPPFIHGGFSSMHVYTKRFKNDARIPETCHSRVFIYLAAWIVQVDGKWVPPNIRGRPLHCEQYVKPVFVDYITVQQPGFDEIRDCQTWKETILWETSRRCTGRIS